MANSSELVRRLHGLSIKLATLEITTKQCANEVNALIEMATCLDHYSPSQNHPPDVLRVDRYTVDRTTFSVSDGTHICELGNTIRFRLIECLAAEPNRYFTRNELLAAVWDGQRRAATTIRSAVFELRSQLRAAGMDDLAAAVRSDGRSYGLTIDDQLREPQRKTNA